MAADRHTRRRFLRWVGTGGLLSLPLQRAVAADSAHEGFFGQPEHRVVYQFNKADTDYMEHVLFSVGAMLRKYPDNIHIVVTAIGPGVHILAKRPGRPVPDLVRQRVESLAMYGVSFHACGNTLKSLGWTADDLREFVEIVDVGAADLMTLQARGYSYISW